MAQDFDIDSFLDNVLKGKSNEELAQIQAHGEKQAQRSPAAASPADSFNDNFKFDMNKPMAPNDKVQVQPTVNVEADNMKFFEPAVAPNTEAKKNVAKLTDDAFKPIKGAQANLSQNYTDDSKKAFDLETQMQDRIKQTDEISKRNYSRSPDLESGIKKSMDEIGAAKVPERDLLSEAILSFAPAIFGSLTGESGALSQVEGGKKARGLYEGQRAQAIEQAKDKNSLAEKRNEALLRLDNQAHNQFNQGQKIDMMGNHNAVTGVGDLLNNTQKSMKDSQDQIIKLSGEESKLQQTGGNKLADLDQSDKAMASREKSARISAANAGQRLQIPTDGERKATFLLGNMEQAQKNLVDMRAKFGKYPSENEKFFRLKKEIAAGGFGDTTMSDFLNSKSINPLIKQQAQAEMSWLEGIGRIQSGAAISPKEWMNFREQYFPTYGDNAETIKQKEQQRVTAMEGVKVMAGRSAKNTPQAIQVVQPNAPLDPKTLTKEQKLQILRQRGVVK